MCFSKSAVKSLFALTAVLGLIATADAQIAVEVYHADGTTPFDCNSEVMVGTKVVLVISSDSNEFWNGGLFIGGQDRVLGTLAGRDFDSNTGDWTSSHYDRAGDFARVTEWRDSSIWGFDFYTFYPVDGNSQNNTTQAGEWFVVDYYADAVGDCNVGFYDYSTSWDEPNFYLTLSNVPTRDFKGDGVVDFLDFAILASEWGATTCSDPNWCKGTDLDFSGYVDWSDLGLFTKYWLWGPSFQEPDYYYPEDPNIIYSIVDTNDSNEITIDVNENVTLYVKMTTTEANNVSIFDIEVNISDTNFASIDNREYDPNDPNASTARILAEPRDAGFDYYGPGFNQEEGIYLSAVSAWAPMSDGNLASFVFTCEGPGDVTLTLINWHSYNVDGVEVFPKLEGLTIHQVDANSQQTMGEGTAGALAMDAGLESEPVEQTNTEELANWLEDLWVEDEQMRETYTEEEWNDLVDGIRDSYP
jgi:hypothetical protein